ncbi:MAG: trypsin-like peptidase domain-containing protein [Myxococcales bacterium]|nr:trypsin-like peptidase domain-containing protein [Myxococcales bacterium]
MRFSAGRALGVTCIVLTLSGAAACRRRPAPAVAEAAPPLAALPPTAGGPTAPVSPSPIAPLSPNARTEDERNTVAIFREAAPSTVFVTQKQRVATDPFGFDTEEVTAGSGSGFIWDAQGHIVTNFHVVQGGRGTSLTVTFFNQREVPAKVVGVEPRKDIAVLKVTAPADMLKPLRVPQTFGLEVGQKTVAIGNPFGLDHTLTTGVISALGRQVQGIGGVAIRDMVQTDAAINPGNSGGPLLDSGGQLIGMNTVIFSKSGASAGIGFAVPVSTIARVVPQLIARGKADSIGLGLNILQRGVANVRGVVVLGVPAGSPAERAGFRPARRLANGDIDADIIVGIDGKKIDNYDDLYSALDAHKAGDKVDVAVRRGEQVVTLKAEAILLNER